MRLIFSEVGWHPSGGRARFVWFLCFRSDRIFYFIFFLTSGLFSGPRRSSMRFYLRMNVQGCHAILAIWFPSEGRSRKIFLRARTSRAIPARERASCAHRARNLMKYVGSEIAQRFCVIAQHPLLRTLMRVISHRCFSNLPEYAISTLSSISSILSTISHTNFCLIELLFEKGNWGRLSYFWLTLLIWSSLC